MFRGGLLVIVAAVGLLGCGVVIEPGHRGLIFDPHEGGLQREVIPPGYHRVAMSARMEDFDITYSTRKERLHVLSVEGLTMDVEVAIIYRPIVMELYELDTEIGRNYYDEIVGPEFRSASRVCFGRHSLTELPKSGGKLEDEVEADVRRRIRGKHIEIASVTIESFDLPPELVAAMKARIEIDAEAARDKAAAEAAWEKEKLKLERNAERRKLEREAEGLH